MNRRLFGYASVKDIKSALDDTLDAMFPNDGATPHADAAIEAAHTKSYKPYQDEK